MKYNIQTMRRQDIDWEKIFAKATFDKGLLCKIYREHFKVNSKKKSDYKMNQNLNRHFAEEYIYRREKNMKRYSTSGNMSSEKCKITQQ